MRKLTIMAALVVMASSVNAQFNQSGGAGLILGLGNVPKYVTFDADRPWFLTSTISYYPQFNIMESGNAAISIGTPVSIGLSTYEASSTADEDGIMFLADLPVMVDLKLGTGSTRDNTSKYGFFFGAGFGYTYTTREYQYFNPSIGAVDQVKGVSYGPMTHIGVNFALGNNLHYFIRLHAKYGLESVNFKSFGLTTGIGL
ncbi:MAG TPA: hypothetical protein VFZ78_04930 [Flavisolibacter sp.]